MRKYKTTEGYYVYKIKKDNTDYYLGDKNNYKKNINDILENIDDLRFDSSIIIFGLDTGAYIDELQNRICEKNKILIIEPNEEVFLKNNKINSDNIFTIPFDKSILKNQLKYIINIYNFNNLFVCDFGNYKEIYKEEYEFFIKTIDNIYFDLASYITLANRFRKKFLENFISNLNEINKSTSINSIIEKNKNIPAFIISAGPSLDKNLEEMIKNKELLEKSVVITGSRTFDALLKTGINADFLVSVDPVDYNYEMIKNHLDSNIPLAFYEYSNKKILKDYKGKKIYLPTFFSNMVEEPLNLRKTYLGGSVAHTCIDMARAMGCNPIILVGQDLAYTYEKHHSPNSIFEFDSEIDHSANDIVKDIYGNYIKTNATLNYFKRYMEEYIKKDMELFGAEYINVSYGADIQGAEHLELKDVFKLNIFNKNKLKIYFNKDLKVDIDKVIKTLLGYLEQYILSAKKCKEICSELEKCNKDISLVEIDDNDENLLKFLNVLEVVNSFESSKENILFEEYFNKFKIDIKNKEFNMKAEDYNRLTSNLKYQSKCFKIYFEELEKMLNEVKSIVCKELED